MPAQSDLRAPLPPNIYEKGTASLSISQAAGKTAYAQVIAALTRNCSVLLTSIKILIPDTALHVITIDLAVGGSGSEVITVPDIEMRPTTADFAACFVFPLDIPVGSRVAVRAACAAPDYSSGPIAFNIYLGFGGRD